MAFPGAAAGDVARPLGCASGRGLDDRTSFRRFCGFGAHEPTPERTAFLRFQRVLVRLSLDRMRFEAATRQLDATGVVVRCGTLVDATLLPSASIQHNAEAG